MSGINLFGLSEHFATYQKASREHMSNGKDITVLTTLYYVTVAISVLLLIWAIYALATFNLPQNILTISIILLIFTGPIIPLILAYIYKGKA